jgi:DNA-binding SARP family transcriptional activator
MGSRKFHEIWIEQCGAARDIKTRFGLKAALDYVVTEKLLDFASAAAGHPEFARELPRFVSEVRRMFTREELRTHIARVEREQREKDADAAEDDDDGFIRESPASVAERARQFATIKELLTARELGTS